MTMFTTLVTERKYSIIASASRSNLQGYMNMMRHANMMNAVKQVMYKKDHAHINPVTGFYREMGMDYKHVSECFEQSVMLSTDSFDKVQELVKLFCDRFEQDCILVQDNDTGVIKLRGIGWVQEIGNAWRFYNIAGTDIETFAMGHNAFTILPNGMAVEVVQGNF
ncbi:MAG: hypothetical protein ACRDCE_20190 [Cetobacterium sp.]|uniref:hypothetical protein n=1 Tax=Cetobacterium sp. TaxID=2071632 RepID=UPI003EE4C5AC